MYRSSEPSVLPWASHAVAAARVRSSRAAIGAGNVFEQEYPYLFEFLGLGEDALEREVERGARSDCGGASVCDLEHEDVARPVVLDRFGRVPRPRLGVADCAAARSWRAVAVGTTRVARPRYRPGPGVEETV